MSNLTNTEYIKGTLRIRENIEQGFLILAERLYEIKKTEKWKGSYDSYQEFLADMRLSEATDSKLRAIHTRFILEYKLPVSELSKIGWSSLYLLASKVDDKDAALLLIEQAKDLKRDDFADAVRDVAIGEHNHVASEKFQMAKCGVCGKLWRLN